MLPEAEAEVGCIQKESWPYDFVPFPDGLMCKQSLLLNFVLNQFASVTFAVIITYTHVCTRVHEGARENWVYYLLSALYIHTCVSYKSTFSAYSHMYTSTH